MITMEKGKIVCVSQEEKSLLEKFKNEHSKFCVLCGAKLVDSVLYCEQCGSKQ
jgi:zinc-ribbon domain